MVVTWCLIMLLSEVVGEVALVGEAALVEEVVLVGVVEGGVEVAHEVEAAVAEAEEVCENSCFKFFTRHLLIRWSWRWTEIWCNTGIHWD